MHPKFETPVKPGGTDDQEANGNYDGNDSGEDDQHMTPEQQRYQLIRTVRSQDRMEMWERLNRNLGIMMIVGSILIMGYTATGYYLFLPTFSPPRFGSMLFIFTLLLGLIVLAAQIRRGSRAIMNFIIAIASMLSFITMLLDLILSAMNNTTLCSGMSMNECYASFLTTGSSAVAVAFSIVMFVSACGAIVSLMDLRNIALQSDNNPNVESGQRKVTFLNTIFAPNGYYMDDTSIQFRRL